MNIIGNLYFLLFVFIFAAITRFMSAEKFQNKYRIPSARAFWHDYNAGLYFVTICTAFREHFFGNIINGEMNLSEIGKYTAQCIAEIPNHFPDAEIPLYVIMPNHMHLIVGVDGIGFGIGRDDVYIVSTEMESETETVMNEKNKRWKNEIVDEKMQFVSQKRGRLSHIIGGLKRAVTRYANQNQITFGWQARFHDHIIRNQNECNRIAEYIENNIAMWDTDCYYA